jgi:hypothetical protein
MTDPDDRALELARKHGIATSAARDILERETAASLAQAQLANRMFSDPTDDGSGVPR